MLHLHCNIWKPLLGWSWTEQHILLLCWLCSAASFSGSLAALSFDSTIGYLQPSNLWRFGSADITYNCKFTVMRSFFFFFVKLEFKIAEQQSHAAAFVLDGDGLIIFLEWFSAASLTAAVSISGAPELPSSLIIEAMSEIDLAINCPRVVQVFLQRLTQ